jgi:hypothetical protein
MFEFVSSWTGLLLVGALCAIVLHRCLLVPLRLAYFYRQQGVRGTTFVPFLGDVGAMSRLRKAEMGAVEMWTHFRDKFNSDIYYLFLGPELRLVLHDLSAVQTVLINRADAFEKPYLMRTLLSPIVGTNSLVGSDITVLVAVILLTDHLADHLVRAAVAAASFLNSSSF